MWNPVSNTFKSLTKSHGALAALLTGIVVVLSGAVFAQQEATRPLSRVFCLRGKYDRYILKADIVIFSY